MIEKDIGTCKGPMLVFGGPYSNLPALRALREIADKSGFAPNSIICTGDIVAYCAEPREAVELVRDWGIHAIQGNVEEGLTQGSNECGCNFVEGSVCDTLSGRWYAYASAQMSNDLTSFLSSLPKLLRFSLGGKRFVVVHGSQAKIGEYIFPSTDLIRKRQEISALNADVIVAGHSGVPFLQDLSVGFWLNAGVIGMPPNDGTTYGWYMTLEPGSTGTVASLKRFEYDNNQAAQKIRAANLPEQYANALLTGLWPSDEVMPMAERKLRGREILPAKVLVR